LYCGYARTPEIQRRISQVPISRITVQVGTSGLYQLIVY
jgi:hypothetical protein